MLRMLEHALAIEKYRNLHVAAVALDINQSTLSRSIKALEVELCVTLFNRACRMEPTDYGRVVLDRARSLLRETDDLKSELAKMRGLTAGTLAIGCGPIVSQTWLGNAFARLAKKHPGLTIRAKEDLSVSQMSTALHERAIDIAVGELIEPLSDPAIVVEPLPRRAGVFCCRKGHPLAGRASVSLKDIAAFPLAGPPLPARLAAALPAGKLLGEAHPNSGYFNPRMCCENLLTVLRIVRGTDAIGATLPEIAATEIKAGRLVILPFQAPWMQTNYGFMYIRGKILSASVEAFRAAAVAEEAAFFLAR
jgi:DNA-binding transcriptional LysR family regulator